MTLSRETELAILYEISALPTRLSDIDAILSLALDKVTRLFGAEVAVFYLREGDLLLARDAQGLRLSRVLAELPAGAVADRGRHALAWGGDEPSPFAFDPLQGRYPAEAETGIPIWSGADLLGWVYAARFKSNPFSASEVSLFNILAEHIGSALAIALSRARDLEHQAELEASNRRLEAMLAEITLAHQQQQALAQLVKDLSTPVLRIANHILLVPLIGAIDHERLSQITAHMLAAISANQARVCIVDVTGVPTIDTHVAGGLVQLAEAAGLLGARTILCGIAPEVAQVVVSLGLGLEAMTPANDLQGALISAMRFVGLKVVKA